MATGQAHVRAQETSGTVDFAQRHTGDICMFFMGLPLWLYSFDSFPPSRTQGDFFNCEAGPPSNASLEGRDGGRGRGTGGRNVSYATRGKKEVPSFSSVAFFFVVQTWVSWQSPLTRRYSREFSGSGNRAVQCYNGCTRAGCTSLCHLLEERMAQQQSYSDVHGWHKDTDSAIVCSFVALGFGYERLVAIQTSCIGQFVVCCILFYSEAGAYPLLGAWEDAPPPPQAPRPTNENWFCKQLSRHTR